MKCTVCNKEFTSEEPKILAMGAYGNPKYMCNECGTDFDIATLDTDVVKIAEAMDRIGKKMASSNPDKFTFDTVNGVMASAGERARLIKEGNYDFSLDETDDEGDSEGFDEIPEELRETEEDRALDEADEEKMKTFNKVYDWILTGAIIAFAGYLVWRILDAFVLK